MALVPGTRNKINPAWTARRTEADGPAPSPAPIRRADAALVQDFDALYERYDKPLFNLIFQWIGNYEDAQDIAVETFASAFKARDSFRGDSQVYTWLYRIAHNHCKNRFKQRDRQREMEGPSLDAASSSEEEGGDASDARNRRLELFARAASGSKRNARADRKSRLTGSPPNTKSC